MSEEAAFHAFRPVPKTGVIFVTSEATKLGFSPSDPEWCNLGQGQPETGELPGAPPRVREIPIHVDDQEYAPVAGLWELREAVASLYNRLYRKGLPSQYSAENVCISGGGRTALTRAAASLGTINLGHFLPDYTAYEELLDIFKAFTSIPILLEGERGYSFTADDLRREQCGQADRPRSEDRNAVGGAGFQDVQHGSGAGLDTAAERTHDVDRHIPFDRDHAALGDQRMARERRLSEEGRVDVLVVAPVHAVRPVAALPTEIQRVEVRAVARPVRTAGDAAPA